MTIRHQAPIEVGVVFASFITELVQGSFGQDVE